MSISTDLDVAHEASSSARQSVHLGIWVSASRCFLVYVAAPVAGGFAGVFGLTGMVLQVLGCLAAISGARTLFRHRHRLRYPYVVITVAVSATTLAAVIELAARVIAATALSR
ncbi:MAG: hypothetical protein ACRCSP_09520 [Rhodoglobus sp.]